MPGTFRIWANPDGDADFYFVTAPTDPEQAVRRIVRAGRQRNSAAAFGFDPIKEHPVLCRMNVPVSGANARSTLSCKPPLNPAGEKKGRNASAGPSHRRPKSCKSRTIMPRDVYQRRHRHGPKTLNVDEGEPRRRFRGPQRDFAFGELDTLCACPMPPRSTRARESNNPAVVIPADDPALRHGCAQPDLHRRHPRQKARGAGRQKKAVASREKRVRGGPALGRNLMSWLA